MEPEPKCTAPEGAPRHAAGNGHDPEIPPAEAFKHAASRFAELKEYAGYYVTAKLDSFKLTLRNIALYAVLGIVGGLVGIGLLITGVVLLLNGFAGLIGEIFPERFESWGGPLVVGLLVVGGAFAGVIFLMKSLTGSSRKRTIAKYENRKREQQSLYAHDVQERAREQVERKQQPQR